VDEKSGQVIPEAQVRWLQGQKAEAETQTNARGEAIQTLPPGTYRLQIDKKGYFPYTDSVQVGGAGTITIMLKPALVGEMLRETRIHFQPNSAEIHPNSYPALDRIVDFLKANPQVRIRIHGHTDIGDKNPQYNIRLSEGRANAVKEYLVQKGIDPQRIQTVGHGNTKPIADNTTIEGRALNRRVEFEVIAP
jgi:outer membrane protein OmpA-like peptidoglycan-associated protein